MKVILGINGACGRMGQRLVHLAKDDPDFELGAVLEAPDHPAQGRDIGEVCGTGPLGICVATEPAIDKRPDVMVDFSLPSGTMAVLPICLDRKIPLVVATTGHTAEQKQEIEAAAHHIALLMAPNMSLAVNVLMKLAQMAGTILKDRDFDVEIIERHHRFKKDSPSGTALHFARLIQQAMGQTELRHGREGDVGARPPHEIGIHAVRVGDNVGEHTIIFSTLGETMELVHRAHSRDCYARGALQAAKFLANRPARRYTMDDVLGL
ncbi:MAG: 4-hydroxy-tetrahydrodipicolinate reductase [Gemmatales bacterium]|nr:MAG: 4-hydroxy-tetrahydrodipicolinate reductase [Gemmatales bacterium]